MDIQASEQYQFFRSLDISVIELIVNQLLITKETTHSLQIDEKQQSEELTIEWSEFFDLFCKLRETSTQQVINSIRSKWHPASMGYSMEKKIESETEMSGEESEEENEYEDGTVSDDYTEDDASESSEVSVTQKSSKKVSSRSNKASFKSANSSKKPEKVMEVHPVFFGYTLLKAKDVEIQRKEKQKQIYQREVRAITKARKFCETNYQLLEKQIQNQQLQRMNKITTLQSTFDEMTHTRRREFDNGVMGATEDIVKQMKTQFDKENSTLKVAFQYEYEQLQKNHQEKCAVEAKELEIKYQELHMLQDAERSIVGNDSALLDSNNSGEEIEIRPLSEPNAVKLEEFAKVEMSRCAKAVTEATTALQRITSEYKILKEELSKVMDDQSEETKKNPAAMKRLQEARSMMNVAETRLKEAAKQTKLVVEELNDAEALLSQANWRRNQEDELLPLFAKFMIGINTYAASKKKVIIALILLAKGNFEQKFDLLIRIAKLSSSSSIVNPSMRLPISSVSSSHPHSDAAHLSEIAENYQTMYTLLFIVHFAKITYEVLLAISLIPFHRIDKDLENYLKRNFNSLTTEGDETGGSGGSSEMSSISEYEMKALLVKLVIYIGAELPFGVTATIFQLKSTGSLSNYSLLQASSLSLLKHGINDFISTAKDLHYSVISFKPALENNHKRDIHEAALAMGAIDQFKPDYTKFLIKQESLKSYYIIPHNTRHFTSSEHYQQYKHWKAVIKAQSLMRAFLQRKISWKIARYQAYEEAKHTAIKQLKTKMLKEYQKREQTKGLGKMKWDAEVRIKQAKLRAAGQAVNRNETVMMMMEENIQQAKLLIDEKFRQILIEENLLQFADRAHKFAVGKDGQYHPTGNHLTLTPIVHFGINSLVLDSHTTKVKTTLLIESGEGNSKNNDTTMAGNPESEHPENPAPPVDAAANEKAKKDAAKDEINEKINAALVALGGRVEKKVFPIDRLPIHLRPKTVEYSTMMHLLKGFPAHFHRENHENALEAMIRLLFSSGEVESTFFLYHRLRFLNKRMITDFKAMELVNEFPSKRLLLKYLTKNTPLHLKEDLIEQFKFNSSSMKLDSILSLLQRLVMTDIDSGLLYYSTFKLQSLHEIGLLRICNDYYHKLLRKFTKYLDLKMESTSTVSSNANNKGSSFVEDEYHSTEKMMDRIQTLYEQQYKRIKDESFTLEKLSLALTMQQEKLVMIRNHSSFQHNIASSSSGEVGKGKKKQLAANSFDQSSMGSTHIAGGIMSQSPIDELKDQLKNVTRQLRMNWMLRYQQALKLMMVPQTLFEGMYELQFLLQEFITTAQQCAKIIIHELYLPDGEKTIPVYQSSLIQGRSISKRGIHGRKMNYYSNGIFFEVCLDYDGIFNGSDEYAGKLGAKERLGAQVINDSQVNGINAPLTLTIDYFGYRLLATAKLPIQQYTFSEDGLIKRMKIELLHGLDKNGENFINKNRIAYNLFRQVSTKINIIEHQVKGKLDFASTLTYGGHLHFYKNHSTTLSGGNEEEFFVRHCWNIFPHELTSFTKEHLTMTANDQAIFWRFLRPEYLLSYEKPLSTDVGSIISYQLSDEKQHLQDLQAATKKLVTTIVPEITMQLIKRYAGKETFTIEDGESLTTDLHKHGINIRHIGLMRSLLWRKLPALCSIYHFEDVLYPVADVSSELRYGDFLRIGEEVFVIQKTEKHALSETAIPLSAVYHGDSLHEAEVWTGRLDYNPRHSSTKSEPLRQLLLLEMIVRTLKQIVRYQLRCYVESNEATFAAYEKHLIVSYCNLLTSANNAQLATSTAVSSLAVTTTQNTISNREGGGGKGPASTSSSTLSSEKFLHEILFMNLRERYGSQGLYWSERKEMIPMIQTQLPYLIHRFTKMVGIQFSLATMIRFQSKPLGFIFIPEDIHEHYPIVKHSITIFPFIEAMNIAKRGKDLLNNTYQNVILSTKPILFYTLSERKGSKLAYNYGVLGKEFSGMLQEGCMLEQSGPVAGEQFIRSISFRPVVKACVDVKYEPSIVPNDPLQHFSFEVFFNCMGGQDTKRTILRNGRYHLGVSRENMIFLTLYESVHSLAINLFPVKLHHWEHMVITFDGTTLRAYQNGQLIKELETERYFYEREIEFQSKYEEQKHQLQKDEAKEIQDLKSSTTREATAFFTTKEGISTLKKMATTILEEEPEENLPSAASLAAAAASGDGNANRVNVQRERKAWATKKAKEKYVAELYETNVKQVKERFEQLLVDLQSTHERQLHNAEEEAMLSIRIGASHADANNRHGDAYFTGNISCLSVYDYCITADHVRQHTLASKRNIHQDTQRIYHEAILKFHSAITHFSFPSDYYLPFMSTYSDCLLYLLKIEPKERQILNSISVLAELEILVSFYLEKGIFEPLVLLLNEIPRDPEFAEIIVKIILSLKQTNRLFLSRTSFLRRETLIYLPMEFGLIVPNRPKSYYEAAAYIFQEVCRDVNYSYIYGDIDLKWITELHHERLIISLVQTAYESKQMKILELTKFYDYQPATTTAASSSSSSAAGAASSSSYASSRLKEQLIRAKNNEADLRAVSPAATGKEEGSGNSNRPSSLIDIAANKVGIGKNQINVITEDYNPLLQEVDTILATIDEDIQVLSYHLPNLEGLDLSYFISLTDFAMEYIKRFSSLKILLLNECYEITNQGLLTLQSAFPYLEHLSLQRLIQITDEGVQGFAQTCHNLQIINCNYCIQLTLQPIIDLLKTNPYLHTIGLANTLVSDEDLLRAGNDLKEHPITSLDLSYCSKLTDLGIQSISESCYKKLKFLNLKGLQRITSEGIQMIACRCWYLEKWYLDDVYLLTDEAFSYNAMIDGRSQTMEKMLSNLRILSLNYCDHLKNTTLRSLSERCRKLEILQLNSCYGMTDLGVSYLMDPLLCADSNLPLSHTLRTLNLAYVTKLTGKQLLEVFGHCPVLEKLDLSGLSNAVTNDFLQALCQTIPSLQSLKVNSCIQLTNIGLCHIAQSLWLEELQINGCHHITDEGIEVIGEACVGIKIFHLLKLRNIKKKTIDFVKKNCPMLQEILYEDEDEMRRVREVEMKEKKMIQKNELEAMSDNQKKGEMSEEGGGGGASDGKRKQSQIEMMKRAYPDISLEDSSLLSYATTANSSAIPSRINSAVGASRTATAPSAATNTRTTLRSASTDHTRK